MSSKQFSNTRKKKKVNKGSVIKCLVLSVCVLSIVCIVQAIFLILSNTESGSGKSSHQEHLKSRNVDTLRRRISPRYIVQYETEHERHLLHQWLDSHGKTRSAPGSKHHMEFEFHSKLTKTSIVQTSDHESIKKLKDLHPGIKIMEDDFVELHLQDTLKQLRIDKISSKFNLAGSGVRVCVIDTGVNDHLHSSLHVTTAVDFTESALGTEDENGHGTFVAGIIASSDPRYRGVSPGISLYSAKVCDGSGSCFTSDVARGIEWCAMNISANVINISLGSAQKFTSACDDLNLLAMSATAAVMLYDIVVVASTGNDFLEDAISAPACSSAVLAVGAVDKYNLHAPYSNAGSLVDVVAPGGIFDNEDENSQIMSTLFNSRDGFGTFGVGTSYSSPHVSGIVAIIRESNKNLDQFQIRNVIKQTAVDLGEEGFDFQYGYGLIDGYTALVTVSPHLIDQTTTTTRIVTSTTSKPLTSDSKSIDQYDSFILYIMFPALVFLTLI